MFDTIGSVIGIGERTHLLDKNCNIPKVGRVFMADAFGTVTGSFLGTSTITSYVESTAGVAQGRRTRLTSFSTGIMFLISLFLSPVFLAIPSFATAPALITVGMYMIASVTKMSFKDDTADSVGGYLAIIMMVLTYSIANGIMFGVLSWIIIKLFTGKIKDIHPVMYVIGVLFLIRIITLAI